MKRLISLIYKDFLLLIRDRAGLIFLFVMPMVLVIVMTGMQEGAFENASSKSVSLLILNADQDEIGATVTDEMSAQDLFAVTVADPSTTEADVQQMVKRGDYHVGISMSTSLSPMRMWKLLTSTRNATLSPFR